MSAILEDNRYSEYIPLIETTDKVLGGPEGKPNIQAKALADRTLFLKKQFEALEASLNQAKNELKALSGFNVNQTLDALKETKAVADLAKTQSQQALDLIPTGFIMPTLLPSEAQISGWVFCGGQEVSRSAYANLFKVIGVKYGEGNKTTTFKLPDFRGMYLKGSLTEHMDGELQPWTLPNVKGRFTGGGDGESGFVNAKGVFDTSGSMTAVIGNKISGYSRGVYLNFDLHKGLNSKNRGSEVNVNHKLVNWFIKY